jgi:hypothetical protein
MMKFFTLLLVFLIILYINYNLTTEGFGSVRVGPDPLIGQIVGGTVFAVVFLGMAIAIIFSVKDGSTANRGI